MNNEERRAMQNEAVMTLLEDHRLIVQWGTGVGKSRVAVRAVSSLMYAGRHRILLLVVERAHKDNWHKEFIEALGPEVGEDVFSSLTVECYASLPKYENTQWDVIVADEAHHLRSDARTDIISTIRADYFLGLSATFSDNNDAEGLQRMLEMTYGEFKYLNFSVQDAIDKKILAEPKINVHVLNIEDCKEDTLVDVSWGWPNAQKELETDVQGFELMWKNPQHYPNMKLHVHCTPKEGYLILDKVYESCKKTFDDLNNVISSPDFTAEQKAAAARKIDFAKNRMLQYALRRKNLLGDCKTAYAEHVLRDIIRDRKFICFCASIEQGKRLNADTIINSKRPVKENDAIIQAFNEGRSKSIFAVGMLQEGANLNGIEAGLIIQLDKKERAFIQKLGRTMRSREPEQHIIVVNHTKDITYLKNCIEDVSSKYITYIDGRTGAPMN